MRDSFETLVGLSEKSGVRLGCGDYINCDETMMMIKKTIMNYDEEGEWQV